MTDAREWAKHPWTTFNSSKNKVRARHEKIGRLYRRVICTSKTSIQCQQRKLVNSNKLITRVLKFESCVFNELTYRSLTFQNKHPDLPKKPLTPYFRYFLEKREKHSKDHPEMSMTELAKMLAKKFAALPEKKKVKSSITQTVVRYLYLIGLLSCSAKIQG